MVERDDGLLQTDGGAEECLRTSTQNLVTEEGEQPTSFDSMKTFLETSSRIFVKLNLSQEHVAQR